MKKKTNKNFYLRIESLSSVVTGSCNYCTLHLPNKQEVEFLVDCGSFLEEGMEELNNTFPFDPSKIKFVIGTHYHRDHTGRFPILYNQGYKGVIYTSKYTTEYIKKRSISNYYEHKRTTDKLLWTENDAVSLINNLQGLEINNVLKVHKNIDIIFFENAHCQGAIMCMVICTYKDEKFNVLFTGDYKEKNSIRKSWIPEAYRNMPVTIVTEATYGISTKPKETFDKLVGKSLNEGESVLVVALGESMFEHTVTRIKQLKQKGDINSDIPVYIETNRKFEISNRVLQFIPSNVTFVRNVAEKMNALYDKNQKIIIITERGGIDFFFPFILRDEKNMILFTNHMQCQSQVYKMLNIPKGQNVVLGNKTIKRMAQVYNTEEFGCHAFVEEIERLMKSFKSVNAVLIGHGDKYAKQKVISYYNQTLQTISCFSLKRGRAFRVTSTGVKYE